MLVFDWLEQTDKIGCNIFPARMTCAGLWCQIVGNTFLNFVSNFSLEGGNWVMCSLTLVVPCSENIFMVLLISALGNITIGATKPIFLDSGSPRGGGGGSFMRGRGLLSLYSSYTKFK